MIKLPNFEKAFEYENNYYLSCDNSRLGKFIAHYELFKMIVNLPEEIVECGVFKGASLMRFAGFRSLFNGGSTKKIIAFDSFGGFPETGFDPDKKQRQKFIADAGDQSISVLQLARVLRHKGVEKGVELVAGDITLSVPEYVKRNPRLKISLLNLDVDIYEPAVTILEYLYPLIVPGGILILDDYGVFPGETKAVDDYFKGKKVKINKFSFAKTPAYIIKAH